MTEKKPKIAIYPGSFDPITMGHVDIIERLSPQFDELVVLVAHAGQKDHMFTTDERVDMAKKSLGHLKNIRVDFHMGLTIDYAQKLKAKIIVRGLRAVVDFEYEMTMANMNRKLDPSIETMLVFASPEYYFVSSRGVKEVMRWGGDVESLIPNPVFQEMKRKLKQK